MEMVEGIQVYRYPCLPELGGLLGYSLEYTYSILMLGLLACFVLFRQGFDTIHMHTPPDMTAVIPAFFRLFGKTFVYDLHDLSPELYMAQRGGKGNRWLHWALLKFERFASRSADMAISTNESQRDLHVNRCDVPFDRFHVVRNGPNEAFLSPSVLPRRELASDSRTTLGYVGVMGIQDGVDYLIQALNLLVNKRGRTDLRLILVGCGSAMTDLQAQVRSLDLEEYTTFTGRVPFADVPSYIASFDICCTPDPSNSYNDSCTTIKTMEYMALAKPIVCFETTENMKTAGHSALYAKNNDIEQYVDLIEKLIDSPELRETMGQSGRKKIVEQLAWNHQATKLLSAYDSLHHIQRETADQAEDMSKTVLSTKSGDIPTKFAFNGAVGQVLQKHLQTDFNSARLSLRFRLYYLLRSFIPTALRQHLQRTRNSALRHADDWYIQSEFIEELKAACQQDEGNSKTSRIPNPHAESVVHPWPAHCGFAVCLTHDIETAEGLKRVSKIADMEESLGLRSAWYFVPHKYPLDHGLLRDLKQRGHEVGVHGYNHDGRLFLSRSIFDARTRYINKAAEQFESSGFRAPMMHRNFEWMQALKFDYDASCFDIDPFQAMPGGVAGVWPFIVGSLVELPYTLPQDHTLMITLGQPAFPIWLRKMELVKKLSGMVMLITHPDYLDSESRFTDYRRFCEHVSAYDDAWKTLPKQIAKWWLERQASTVCPDGSIVGPAKQGGRVVPISSLFEF